MGIFNLLRYLINKKSSIFILLILLLPICKAQSIDYSFTGFVDFNTSCSDSIFFRIENLNFFKNNEYESDITEGYTLTGGMIKPQFMYYLNNKLRLSIGARLLKYSGQEKINKASLLLSAVYKPNNKTSIILGELNNNDNHNMPEFLISSENYYIGDGENGIQFLFKGKRLDFDSWIDWENFIEKKDSLQEEFTVGLSSRLYLCHKGSRNTFSIPVYLSLKHRGGEIDISDRKVSTITNMAIGMDYRRLYSGSSVKSMWARLIFTNYKSQKGESVLPFNNGHGLYASLGLQTKIGDFMAGYWHSEDYFSPKGLDIFHSVSSFDAQYYDKKRKLLNLKYIYRYDIGQDSRLVFSLEDYLDIEHNKNNISASVFLIINTNIFIKKLKK